MGERAAVDRASRFLGVEVVRTFGSIGVIVVEHINLQLLLIMGSVYPLFKELQQIVVSLKFYFPG